MLDSFLLILEPNAGDCAGIAGGFFGGILIDSINGTLQKNEVKRAIELRNIVTSLGPAYIKLGQALSIRPDLLSPAAMNELQKLCDKARSLSNCASQSRIFLSLFTSPADVFCHNEAAEAMRRGMTTQGLRAAGCMSPGLCAHGRSRLLCSL